MKEIFNPLKFNQNVKNHSVIDNFLNTIQRAESTLSYGGEKKKKKKKTVYKPAAKAKHNRIV